MSPILKHAGVSREIVSHYEAIPSRILHQRCRSPMGIDLMEMMLRGSGHHSLKIRSDVPGH